MKAAVYYSQNDIRVKEIPTPKTASDEILVEMKACGICGSDLMEWYLAPRAPLVLGHEPSGIVAEVGENVENFDVGDRVFAHHHVACLNCYYCKRGAYTLCQKFAKTHLEPGGFAEFFKVPAPNLQLDTLKLPPNVSFEEATLIEPVGCSIRALTKCKIESGDAVAIIGAGPSGIINAVLAKHFGASTVILSDFVEFRLKAAVEFGVDMVVNPSKESLLDRVKELTDCRGADQVIVTAPSVKAVSEAVEICRKGGTICVFAPTAPNELFMLNVNKFFFNEIKMLASYSTSHIETRRALEIIKNGEINAKKLITHKFPLSQIQKAFNIAAREKNSLKVIVTCDKS